MEIKINEKGFKQAEALFKDIIFSYQMDVSSPEDLKNLKLLKARQGNLFFEYQLALFICGERENSFPYRSSALLTKFFKSLGFLYVHDGSTRRFWVQGVLFELTIQEISFIIENGLFNKSEFLIEAQKNESNFEEDYKKAISEFKTFINNSLDFGEKIDLSYLLDFNINTEILFNNQVNTNDKELNKLINEAKTRFYNPDDKQIAIEKLWDAFERMKTYFNKDKKQSSEKLVATISMGFDKSFFESEFKVLTSIGNEYRIRHHESNKKEILDSKHLNYLFFRMLSLIDLCLKFLQ